MKRRTTHRSPLPGQAKTLSPEQKAALERLLNGDRAPSRGEMHEKPSRMDIENLNAGLERVNDPSDPVLDWDEVKRELLDQE
jgi:hypothetical protein